MRRPRPLPRLFAAALAFVAGAVAPVDAGPLCAALGIFAFTGREAVALVPFVVAGRVSRSEAPLDATAPPAGLGVGGFRCPRDPVEVRAWVRALEPAVESADGRARQRVTIQLCSHSVDGDAVDGELLLPERALALPRGAVARASGRLRGACDAANPGSFPLGAELLVDRRSALQLHADDASPFERLLRAIDRCADAIAATLRLRLAPETAGFTEAVVLGRTAHLDPALIDALRATGAWHLLAVSGSHVALIAACCARLLPLFALPEAAELLLTLAATLGYALLTGAQAPALRAAITFAGALPLLRGRRTAAPIAWLGAAFLVVVALQPGAAREAGAQLSFAAVVALSVAARHGPARSPRGSGRGLDFTGAAGRTLRFALAAGLATMPLCVWHFGTAAPWSPLATLLLAPLVSIAMVVGLLAAAVLPLLPAAAAPFDFALSGVDHAVAALAHGLDRLPLTPWELPVASGFTVALLVAVWIALLARRQGIAALLSAIALTLGDPDACEDGAPSRAVLLAVGHGQTLLVQQGGRALLSDCGGLGSPPGANLRFARTMRALGADRLDALLLSHLDGDHADLAPALLESGRVRVVVVAPPALAEIRRRDGLLAAAITRAATAAGAAIRGCTRGDEAFGAHVLWPPDGREFGERNSGCLALRFDGRGLSLDAPGDLEGYPLLELARQSSGPIDVLLLPHHGNRGEDERGEALAALLAALRPRFALASRDSDLPPSTVAALLAAGVPWLSTARGGAIGIAADPLGDSPDPGLRIGRGREAAEVGACFRRAVRR
jgi:competence protein ComEC